MKRIVHLYCHTPDTLYTVYDPFFMEESPMGFLMAITAYALGLFWSYAATIIFFALKIVVHDSEWHYASFAVPAVLAFIVWTFACVTAWFLYSCVGTYTANITKYLTIVAMSVFAFLAGYIGTDVAQFLLPDAGIGLGKFDAVDARLVMGFIYALIPIAFLKFDF